MKTTQATDDHDPYEKYRREYLRTMQRISDALRRAGRFGGRR